MCEGARLQPEASSMKRQTIASRFPGALFLAVLVSGCSGTSSDAEDPARSALTAIAVAEAARLDVLAGVATGPGSADGWRTAARFVSPGGITWEWSEQRGYVTDSGSHVVRVITPGGDGAGVSTFAGKPGVS